MWNIVLLLFLFAATQIVAALLATLLSTHTTFFSGATGATQAQAICSLLCYIVLMGLLLSLRLVRRNPFRRLQCVQRTAPWLPLLSFLLLSTGVSFLLSPLTLNDNGTTLLFRRMLLHPEGWLLLCVAGPLVEEYIFREGIQRHLLMFGLRNWASVVISAVLFATVHINPAQMVPAFVMGAALGLFYMRTGNLRLCTVAHILNNTLAVALMLLQPTNEPLIPSPSISIAIGIISAAIGALGLRYWWKKTQLQ